MARKVKSSAVAEPTTEEAQIAERKRRTAINEKARAAVSAARVVVADKFPMAGIPALHLRPVPDWEIKTAAVSIDGTMRYQPDWFLSLKKEERAGVVAHEAFHCALLVWARQGGRKEIVTAVADDGTRIYLSLWNIAHDYAINLLIRDADTGGFIKLPKQALLDDKYKGMSAEEIYDQLLKDLKDKPGDPDAGDFGDMAGDVDEDGGSSTQTGKDAESGNSSAQKELEQEWKANAIAGKIEQERRGRGKLPAWLTALIDSYGEAKLSWLEELSRWVGENGRRNDYNFSRPSRRSDEVGEYLPSLVKHGVNDNVTILLDTSGSIGVERLKEAVAEIQGVCDELGVDIRVINCDADVHEDLKINNVGDLISSITGGGGSDFRPAFERLEKDNFSGVVIAITDGEISVPETFPNFLTGVLWVLKDKDRTPATWGEVVRVPAV